MRCDLDASRVVCRVCGEVEVLDTDAQLASTGLAAFTAQHSGHERFRIDVVTGPVREPRRLQVPLQRATPVRDTDARTA